MKGHVDVDVAFACSLGLGWVALGCVTGCGFCQVVIVHRECNPALVFGTYVMLYTSIEEGGGCIQYNSTDAYSKNPMYCSLSWEQNDILGTPRLPRFHHLGRCPRFNESLARLRSMK